MNHTFALTLRTTVPIGQRLSTGLIYTGNLDDPWFRDHLHHELDAIIDNLQDTLRNHHRDHAE